MVSHLISFIESIVVPLGFFGVFIGSILEEVVAIIPSALTQMMYGFLLFSSVPVTPASFSKFFLFVSVGSACGVTVGALPWYFLARHGGTEAVLRFGKYVGFYKRDLDKIENYLSSKNKLDAWAIFIGRSMPFIPSIVICAGAGIFRIRIRTFIIYTFLGTLVRATIYGFIGWQLGMGYKKYATLFDTYEKYVLGLVIVIFLWGIWYIRRRNKQNKMTLTN